MVPQLEFSSILIAVQPTAISVILHPNRTYTFDPSGRVVALYLDGVYFARSLSGELKEKSWRGAVDEFDRHIRPVDGVEKETILMKLRDDLLTAREAINKKKCPVSFNSHRLPAGRSFFVNPLLRSDNNAVRSPLEVLNLLIDRFDQLGIDEKTYQRIYQPISILPPDHYFTIVLQITEGCPWNKCAFCDFYSQRSFRIRSSDEIDSHINDVASFLAEGAALRNTIFLADANAFVMKAKDLEQVLLRLAHVFPSPLDMEPRRVSSFADVPAILAKTDHDLKKLKAVGLSRLYIGLESGSDVIRTAINKPGQSAEVVRAVKKLKSAGFDVGLIVMLGLGGKEAEEDHVQGTINTLAQLPLLSSDIVFFSPYYPDQNSPYARVAAERGWHALGKEALRKQVQLIKSKLALAWPEKPRWGVYDIREFVY